MLLSALLISESKAECILLTADPLFLITVDSQKAFDVVNHIIIFDKMYETGVHPTLWTIVKDFYDGLTSQIKWCGDIIESFPIKHGVRQVGVLSTFIYKVYNNALLQDVQNQKLGFMIGITDVGCPTCADVIALLSNNVNELQDMLLTLHRHSRQDRVSIHPTKTKAVISYKTSKIPKNKFKMAAG
jgi:hypothetical protein